MAATEGFSIEISSRYDGWWRYNAALMCGCFDAGDERIGFASAESHVADVGANLTAKPADMAGDRSLRLETAACDHLLLYIYIVPHTLPAGNDIADTQPFEITLRIAYGGKVLRSEKRLINQVVGRIGRDAGGSSGQITINDKKRGIRFPESLRFMRRLTTICCCKRPSFGSA